MEIQRLSTELTIPGIDRKDWKLIPETRIPYTLALLRDKRVWCFELARFASLDKRTQYISWKHHNYTFPVHKWWKELFGNEPPVVPWAELGIPPEDGLVWKLGMDWIVVTRDKRVWDVCGRFWRKDVRKPLSVSRTVRGKGTRLFDLSLIWRRRFANEIEQVDPQDKVDLSSQKIPIVVTRDARFWDLTLARWCTVDSPELGGSRQVYYHPNGKIRATGKSARWLYAMAFVPKPKGCNKTIFVDELSTELSVTNIAWVKAVPRSKPRQQNLDPDTVLQIYTDRVVNQQAVATVAAKYQVGETSVSSIVSGRTYADVTAELRATRDAPIREIPVDDKIDLTDRGCAGIWFTKDGRVWSQHLHDWMRVTDLAYGQILGIRKTNGGTAHFNLVRLWAECWLPNPNGYTHAQFIDPAVRVYSAATIHWVPTSAHARRVCTPELGAEILRLATIEHLTTTEIAKRVGVGYNVARNIIHGHTYHDVK